MPMEDFKMRVGCYNLWSQLRPVCQNVWQGGGEKKTKPLSKAAMDLCICSSSLQSDHQIWAMNFSDWNECRVSLEQDNLLSPDFKTVALHLSCIDMIIQVACNNLLLYILYSMCSSLPALRGWIRVFCFFLALVSGV